MSDDGIEKSTSVALVAPDPARRRKGGDAPRVVPVVPEGQDPDTWIPDTYVGNPIAPNKYCRAWNGKRNKYCRKKAGFATTHPGQGRCRNHEGRPITTGARVRYDDLHHRDIRQLVEKYESDIDPLNMLGELALLRALLTNFINEYQRFLPALLGWYESYSLVRPPIPDEFADSYERSVTEWAIKLQEGGEYTDLQIADVTRAKKFIEAFRKPVDEGRPRKVVDIIEARHLIDSIGKLVDRLDKRNTISEAELNRTIQSMGRVVDVIIPNGVIPAGTLGEDLKRLIREGWMRSVTR